MVVQELIAKLGFDVDQNGLQSVDNALRSFAKKLTIAAAGIYAVKKAVEAAVWGISESISAAAQKEDVTTQFKVMLGDLEAAKYLYQEINQYASVSPFETAGLADNVRQMMSFGQTAKQAFEDIKMLGDVALGDQNKLNRLALVYSQTFSAKKLTGGDLLQYINAGFNPLESISRTTGKSMADLRKQMEKGLITSDMVRQAFVDATSAGGKFYKGAEEGSKTWNGMLSTARDNLRMLGAELGDRMLPFLKEVLLQFSELWVNIRGSWMALADFFGIMFENGPKATQWAEGLAWAFQRVADAIMFVALMWQSFIVDLQFIKIIVYGVVGGIADILMYFGMLVGGIFRDTFKLMAYAGKHLGIKSLQGFGDKNAQEIQGGIDKNWGHSKFAQWGGGAVDDLMGSLDKQLRMADKIGTVADPAEKIKMTSKMEGILAGAAGKQPVTINNNNQTNNLTINAEDPIKSIGEAQAAKFFQGAFIQLRAATV